MTTSGAATDARARRRVEPQHLRWVCAVDSLAGDAALDLGLGQDRAIAAIEMGAAMPGRGYNIYAAGSTGTGRSRSAQRVLERLAAARPVPPDRAYVHNFARPDRPRLLTLPPGRAVALRRSMERFVELLRAWLPTFYDDEIVESRRRAITDTYQRKDADLFRELSTDAESKGFAVVKVQTGQTSRPEVVPVLNEEPVPFERLRQQVHDGALSADEFALKQAEYDRLRGRLAELVRRSRDISREMNAALEQMVREEAERMLSAPMADIDEAVGHESVSRFLRHVREDVLDTLTAPFGRLAMGEAPELEERLSRYRVNVVADRSGLTGAPVVIENYPSLVNLFGGVSGPLAGDGPPRPPSARDIGGGSILAADGGFLILKARDALSEAGVWDALKRTLATGFLEIQRPSAPSPFGFPLPPLKPEPIPINLRVVLVGEPMLYDLLWAFDPDFRRTFMVKAEFDPVMDRTDENIGRLCRILEELGKAQGLLPLAADGGARVLEWSARQAGGRGKLLARLSETEDLLREAHYQATRAGAQSINAAHVDAALNLRRNRNGRLEERALELMEENVIRIAVSGERVGQVNGLSVLDLGYHRFGKPTRITATASVGRAGIINIEREARLSGGIYDKGVLIITGWLRRRYAQTRALTLTASLCFEQSYSGVDGDSASIAELIALLSELSEFPVDQAVAVTGSIDQHGDIQPIGGINEKVEGFFDLCRARGLDGKQGVMFPEANVPELNLRSDVVEAVEAGQFSLYALHSLADALEIAMRNDMDAIDSRVKDKLKDYSEAMEEGAYDLAPTPSPTGPAPAPPLPPPPIPPPALPGPPNRP